MSKVLKARVISGRYQGETVRISNVSTDDRGRKNAACSLSNNQRVNIPVSELEIIEEKPEAEVVRAKVSMPFVSGSSSSRTLTHTKNMNKPSAKTSHLVKCEKCGAEYNREQECERCAESD